MENKKIEDLYKYLHENNLKIDSPNVPEYFKCTICGKIMEDAVVSTCGCGFCNPCIRNFIDRDSKLCPGCMVTGNLNQISYEEDVREDIKSKVAIMKFSVKCPYFGCTEIFEIRCLLDHLFSCNMSKFHCIFQSVGCEVGNLNKEELQQHLDRDRKIHYTMMLTAIGNLRHDLDGRKEFITEVNKLDSVTVELRLLIEKLEKDMENSEIKRVENESDLNVLKNELIRVEVDRLEKTEKMTAMQLELNQLKSDREEIRQKVALMEVESEQMKRFRVWMEDEARELRNILEGRLSEENNMKSRIKCIEGEAGAAAANVSPDRYEWKAFRLSSTGLFKDRRSVFTISGYRLSSEIYKFWGTIYTRLYIMRSGNDSDLQWPIPITMRVTVVDIESDITIDSTKFSCKLSHNTSDYDRPTLEKVQLRDSVISISGDQRVKKTDAVIVKVEAVPDQY